MDSALERSRDRVVAATHGAAAVSGLLEVLALPAARVGECSSSTSGRTPLLRVRGWRGGSVDGPRRRGPEVVRLVHVCEHVVADHVDVASQRKRHAHPRQRDAELVLREAELLQLRRQRQLGPVLLVGHGTRFSAMDWWWGVVRGARVAGARSSETSPTTTSDDKQKVVFREKIS